MALQEWTNLMMKDKHSSIRKQLQEKSDTIKAAYQSKNCLELEQKMNDSGQELAKNLLGDYNRILQERGQPSIVFDGLEMRALAAICTFFLEAVTKLMRIEPENKGERNWVKSEVHSCAANTSQAIHFTFGEKVFPRYIGNGDSRRAVLHVAREFFGVNSDSLIRF
jgi:hypothetical protein